MSYNWQYTASIVVAITLGVIGAIQLADPAELQIAPVVVAWAKIAAVGLGIAAGFLPRVTAPPNDSRVGKD